MHKTEMIAEYLRTRARWRLDRADDNDGGANARAAIGLIDAAAYVEDLQDSDRIIVRLTVAGCFALGRFSPGVEGERLIRFWHYDDPAGDPADLFEMLLEFSERSIVPQQRARI